MIETGEAAWLPPPARPVLEGEEVHVWRMPLDVSEAISTHLASWLDPGERERAGRFVAERLGRRFRVAHGGLRAILGRYLGLPPRSLEIRADPGGKPSVRVPGDRPRIRFNLTHSGDLALVAVGLAREVGIDVEGLRPMPDADAMVARYFAPEERAAYVAMPPEDRLTAFFRIWTRKEAFLKARGDGLRFDLRRFAVTAGPGPEASLLHVDGDATEARRWDLLDLRPTGDTVAACVVEGEGVRLKLWNGTAPGVEPWGEI